MTLTEFLLARIAEDEYAAQRAHDEAPGLTWEPEKVYDGIYSIDLGPATHPDADSFDIGEDIRIPREMARHISQYRPTRMLTDCEARRTIVEHFKGDTYYDQATWTLYRLVLQTLALPYADHADYDESWRP